MNSIVGPNELKKIVAKNSNNKNFYIPGERPRGKEEIQDSYGLENLINGKFGASLHNHTVHSDGAMKVEEILNQAADYADTHIKQTGEPFYLGITDHNTVEGCKETVLILAKNPDKYRNLKVVLGSEITVKEDKITGVPLNKPRKLHILVHSLNPFDKEVNSFINDLTINPKYTEYLKTHNRNTSPFKKNNPMQPKQISLSFLVDKFKNQKDVKFSFAHPAYPDIKKDIPEEDNHYDAITKIIHFFKKKTKDKGLYVESHYNSYYGDVAKDIKLHQIIEEASNQAHLEKAGAIDTHGTNIFYTGVRSNKK